MAGIVTYAWPVVGANPPSLAIMKKHQTMQATVEFTDADTTAVVTHNFGSPNSDLSSFFPIPKFYLVTQGTGPFPVISIVLTNSVALTLAKQAGLGTGGTILLTVERLFSELR